MLLPPTTILAKLFAASGFRRRSYDDQEGDNDINIILQPSDLHDIEKMCKLDSSGRVRARAEAISSPPSQTTITDLNLAKCLLDQDYNLTVRLFITKSALNWNFNSFTFDALCCGRSLTELLLHLFDYYDLYKIFNLNIVNVLKCFRLLEFGYHSTNPYHNSIHAADVTQAMHCFIQENKIRKHMTHLETLCSILAAVCHDLDHPGVNQSFLVATNNPLASLYNNNSVLENHHWRFALCIFKESQLFDHFEEETFKEMKKQLKHLILATDIARQNEYLKRFKDLTMSREFSMENTDDRALVLQMALKCADLGNPCRPWLISRVWSNLICDEFYKMGRTERRLGIPLTPICQREKTSIAGIQADFFRFIVLPLLELWHKFLDSPLSNLLMSNFNHNYQRWQRANRVVQQLRRRKSLACLEPMEAERGAKGEEEGGEDSVGLARGKGLEEATNEDLFAFSATASASSAHSTQRISTATLGLCSRHSFAAMKRASSDYVKSGNGGLELLRNFQLDRIIEKSPLTVRSNSIKRQAGGMSGGSGCRGGSGCSTPPLMADSVGQGGAGGGREESKEPSCFVKCSYSQVKQQQNASPTTPNPTQTPVESKTSDRQQQQQQLGKQTRTNQSINSSRSLAMCSSYRKALSPIEDGDAPSPDQQQVHQQDRTSLTKDLPPVSTTSTITITTTTSAFPSSPQSRNSSSSASSSVSQASSACSSPVIQRSISSRTSIDQLTSNSAVHLHHHLKNPKLKQQQHQQQQHRAQIQHHPLLAQYYEPSSGTTVRSLNLSSLRQATPTSIPHSKSLYTNKRRESDPGCCSDKYELAAAIVLIQYQSSSFFHKRRSSLPVCVTKRRSSK